MQPIVTNNYYFQADLEIQIKVARRKMEKLWVERGFTDENVLAASVELDQLLNQYQRLLYNSELVK